MPAEQPPLGGVMGEALGGYRAGRGVVVVAETPDGSADALLSRLDEPARRLEAGPSAHAEGQSPIDRLPRLDGVVIVEQAQRADLTFLGSLRGRLEAARAPFLLMVVAEAGADGWMLGRLAEEAGIHAVVHRLEVDGPPSADRSRAGVGLRRAGALLTVVLVAAVTSYAVTEFAGDPPTAPVTVVQELAVAPPSTVVQATPREENQIDVPVEFLFGVAPYRGGPTRTGVFDAAGPRQVDGYYWSYETAGPILATPVAYGRSLLVPSADGTLYALDQTRGEVSWTLDAGGRLTGSPGVASGEGLARTPPAVAVVAGDDGVVRARDAVTQLESEAWSLSLGSRVTSSPVMVGSRVFAATVEGVVHAIDLASGAEVWRHPSGSEGLGTVTAPLTYHEGVLYVGTEEGDLYLLEEETGEQRCSFFASAGIVASPVVADGAVLLPTRGNTVFALPVGDCRGPVVDRLPSYLTETAVEVAPAVLGDRMYLPSGQFLYAIDLEDNSHAWRASTVDAGDVITAAPVVAGGVVYFGTRSGSVRAVDAGTGEALWRWELGSIVRASPVVVDGAVFIAGGDGRVLALGPR